MRLGELHNGRRELLPELGIDMLDGIDAETVDAIGLDPILVDIDHPFHDRGMFGEEVIQAKEVAIERILAGEG